MQDATRSARSLQLGDGLCSLITELRYAELACRDFTDTDGMVGVCE